MPTIQSSFSQQVFSALPGQFAESCAPRQVTNRFASGLLRAGLGCFKVPATSEAVANRIARGTRGQVYNIVTLGTVADVDAIGTGVTSATGTKTIGSGVTAGVAGSAGGPLQPARKLTVVFDASTDWDATTAVITYVNQLGVTVSENLSIATSTTATTTGYAVSFVSLAIPAQTGSGGTATIGIAALSASTLTLADFAGVVVRQPCKTMHNASELYGYPGVASSSPNAHYVDGDTVPMLEFGQIWVETEEAVADRDPVYVRIAAGAGGSQIGAFRNDDDTSSCLLLTGARFKRSAASGCAWIDLAKV